MLESYLSVRPDPHAFSGGSSGKTAVAVEAIVLSRLPGSGTLLTYHQVGSTGGGRRALLDGRPVDRDTVIDLLSRLADDALPGFLPANVVACNPSGVAWWVPSRHAPQFWSLPSGKLRLQVPWPALYFVAGFGGALRIYALAQDARPSPNTPLYHAPLGNIYESATMCWGNIDHPSTSLGSIPAFEHAVYRTQFTHPNFNGNLRSAKPNQKDALLTFWRKLHSRKSKSFPVRELVAAGITAGAALKR